MVARRTITVLASVALAATAATATANPAGASTDSRRIGVWPAAVAALPSQLQRPATVTTQDYLSSMLRRVKSRVASGSLGRDVSVYVSDLVTGEEVYSHRKRNGQMPASTMKTVTTLAVLSAVGTDHRMPTTVNRSEDGRTLTIVGGGDPLLESANLRDLAVKTAAAVRAQGTDPGLLRLNFDDSLFTWPTPPAGWPSSYYTEYANRPFALTRRWVGTSDGALDAARYFRTALREQGLRVRKKVTRVAGTDDPVLTQYDGHTIIDAVSQMLPPSDNSIAENLIRHVALVRGMPTTAAGSAAAVTAQLRDLGIPLRGVRIVDGSGLSRSNTVTAEMLAAVMRELVDPQRPQLSQAIAALPRAGITGTLEPPRFSARLTRCARDRVMAKTGTLSVAVALSGIAAGTDGRPRVFTILVNWAPSSTTTTRYWVDRIATGITGCR